MAKRRKRKRRHSLDESELDRDDGKAEPFRPAHVPANMVPDEFIDDRSFRPAGLACRRCGWTTTKRGFSGIQAQRGHQRKHAEERRAINRPMRRQAGLVALVLAFGMVVMSGLVESPVSVESPYEPGAAGLALAAVSLALAVWLAAAASRAARTFTYGSIRAARILKAASVLPAILSAGAAVTLEPAPGWYWSVPPVILLAFTIPFAGSIGVAEHGARRGKRQSDRYFKTLKPTSDVAEFDYEMWTDSVIRAVRSGQVRPSNLRGAASTVFDLWRDRRSRTRQTRQDRQRGRRRA